MRAWLKNLRDGKALTMKETAEKLDISESYYCAIENGTRQKKMDMVLVTGIATVMGVPIAEVVELEREYTAMQSA